MGRTNVPIDDELHARLSELKGDRTWNELLAEAADALEDDDGGGEVGTQPAHITPEQVDEIARATASEVENRLTRH